VRVHESRPAYRPATSQPGRSTRSECSASPACTNGRRTGTRGGQASDFYHDFILFPLPVRSDRIRVIPTGGLSCHSSPAISSSFAARLCAGRRPGRGGVFRIRPVRREPPTDPLNAPRRSTPKPSGSGLPSSRPSAGVSVSPVSPNPRTRPAEPVRPTLFPALPCCPGQIRA